MKNSNIWRKTGCVLTVMKVGVQIVVMGMIVAADKVLSLVKREKVKK